MGGKRRSIADGTGICAEREKMARKESITITNILETAFELARQEGFEGVTARKLAAKAGCSTQPIFRVYKNMEELEADMFEHAVTFFAHFYNNFDKSYKTPFVNVGMAYIEFARQEKNLFRMLFLKEKRYGKSFYEILNGKEGFVVKEIGKAKADGCKDASGMFMHMWMLIHGAACMTITGDYDLSDEETVSVLENAYSAFKAGQ